jgi:hypothetical protein
MQPTQSDGNARRHFFIISSSFLPCLIAACTLKWNYARLIPTLTVHQSLLLDCMFYVQLQIILLNGQEHDGNSATR